MNSIEAFLKDNLHEKIAYVFSEGLFLEGSMEQKCKFEFIEYSGLHCYTKLEHNNFDVINEVIDTFIQNRENFNIDYDQRDQIINILLPKMKDMYIQCGKISVYNIQSISSFYNKDVLKEVEIKYLGGSIVKIRSIETAINS